MTTFDDRERAFETKFAHDEELRFRVIARRNRLLGGWAARLMGLSEAEAEAYAKDVIRADFEEAGEEDVVRKLLGDLTAAGIAKLPLNLTLLKSCDVCGVFWGAFAARDPQANAAHVEQLFRWWDEGRIAPKISATYPLERAGEAIAALRDRKAVGKLVVTL